MKKIVMELSDADISLLDELISTSTTSLKTAFKKAKAATDNEVIVHERVCIAVDKLSVLSLDEVTAKSNNPKTQNLKLHFFLSLEDKRSLAPYFIQILQMLGSKNIVSPAECEALKVFEDCCKLILKRI